MTKLPALKPAPKVPPKLPAKMGACADLLFDVREARLSADKYAAALKAEEERIKDHIVNNLDKREESGAAGKHHRVQIVPKTKPRVDPEKWDAFFGWVSKNKRWDMLQRRINDTAALDVLANSKAKVPGLGTYNALAVSLTKI